MWRVDPAYAGHQVTRGPYHHRGLETQPVVPCGVRLALGGGLTGRAFGVSSYLDFPATAADWAGDRNVG